MNLDKNYLQILKIATNNGGKSKAFFFNSFDNQYVIKSINRSELYLALNTLEQYVEHLKKYPNSLIIKIFGIYTIHFKKNNYKQNIMLMEHIAKVPRDCII